MIEDEFLEDGEMFEDEEKFWEEMNVNKRKKMEDEVEEEEETKEEEKMEKEVEVEEKIIEEEKKMEKVELIEKMEVKEEEKMEKEEKKVEVKRQCMNFDKKNKRRRERDEDTREYNIYKKKSVSKCFENACELLANDKSTLSESFQEYPSMFARHYKSLERIVYEWDRLKKRTLQEVTWIFGAAGKGQIQWAEEYLKSNILNFYFQIKIIIKNIL
jgi:hypothetical protein